MRGLVHARARRPGAMMTTFGDALLPKFKKKKRENNSRPSSGAPPRLPSPFPGDRTLRLACFVPRPSLHLRKVACLDHYLNLQSARSSRVSFPCAFECDVRTTNTLARTRACPRALDFRRTPPCPRAYSFTEHAREPPAEPRARARSPDASRHPRRIHPRLLRESSHTWRGSSTPGCRVPCSRRPGRTQTR